MNKQQQEVLRDLELLLARRGRAWLLGWALGQLIRLSQHDYDLRRRIHSLTKL